MFWGVPRRAQSSVRPEANSSCPPRREQGNRHMQKAIVLAQICLYAAVLIPFFSDQILGLSGTSVGVHGLGCGGESASGRFC